MKKLFLSLFFLVASVNVAEATTRYVSPSGSGSTCSSGTPCSLTTGLTATVAGDTLILKNGTYNTGEFTPPNSGTASARITMTAENCHQAILNYTGASGGNAILTMKRNYWTVKCLTFQGNGSVGPRNLIWHFNAQSPSTGVIIENNRFLNSGGTAIQSWGVRNGIYRKNYINGTGYNPNIDGGSPFYLGRSSGTQYFVDNLEIVGNEVDDSTNNIIDFKFNVTNVNAHHNIFKNHTTIISHTPTCPTCGAQDGVLHSSGTNQSAGNRFDNNIIGNVKGDQYAIIRLKGQQVNGTKNVMYNIPSTSRLWAVIGSAGAYIWSNNTFCNTGTTNASEPLNAITLTSNRVNQAQSVCDEEVARILSEIGPPTGTASSTTLPASPSALSARQ
jgi:hypothetical protein